MAMGPMGLISIINLIMFGGAVFIAVLVAMALIKVNRALDIWLRRNGGQQ